MSFVCVLAALAVARPAHADTLTIAWDPASDSRVAGYWVYVGTSPGAYTQTFNAGKALTFSIPDTVPGQRYYVAVSSYWDGPVTGAKSREVNGYSNAPPALTRPANQTNTVGQPVTLRLQGSDPLGDALSYRAEGLPPGLALTQSTGEIRGSATQPGTFPVRATVLDGVLSSTQQFNWTIQPPPQAGPTNPPASSPTTPRAPSSSAPPSNPPSNSPTTPRAPSSSAPPSNLPSNSPTTPRAPSSNSVTGAGGTVQFLAAQAGSATNASVVSTAQPLPSGTLFVAVVSTRPYRPVTSMTGLGLQWRLVKAQCGGRKQTGVDVWIAQGTPAAQPVTATLFRAVHSAVIGVSAFSGAGAEPLGAVVAANSNGVGGTCEGGIDNTAYSVPLQASTPNALVFSATTVRHYHHEPGAGYTERYEVKWGEGGSVSSIAAQDRTVQAPGQVNVEGTFSRPIDWALIGLEIRPAP